MADPRTSSFLPTIKCSMCAQDIEISMMGEHVCAIAPEPTPPPEKDRTFEKRTVGPEKRKAPGLLKPRVPLARVDTAAANRPFIRQDQVQRMTPVSANSSHGTLSPYSVQPLRSATSPNHINNGLGASDVKYLSNQRQMPNGNFLDVDQFEDPEQFAPVSPRTAGSGGLLHRMNAIAPGPFDIDRRRPSDSDKRTSNEVKETTPDGRTMFGHRTQNSIGAYNEESGLRRPKFERSNGYGGFGPPHSRNEEPLEQFADVRNPTVETLLPHEQNPYGRPSNTETSATSGFHQRKPSIPGPDLSRPLPPRGATLIGGRDESRLAEGPPIPGVDLASEFGIRNPYHTSSESRSSSMSESSERSNTSSRSSPPASISGSRRSQSRMTDIDLLINGMKTSIADVDANQTPHHSNLERPAKEQFARDRPPQLSPGFREPAAQGWGHPPVSPRATPPQLLQRSAAPKNIRRPATAKGNCKGCSLPIKGKSVSSADGRLSGRYHKQCFVCTTCNEAFATTSFYVLDDAPYCERHYHQLNDSMCHSCDRGIEGQYLETEDGQKFHPQHFSCSDCKRVLKGDYFEMHGKVYCERDAFRRTQQGSFLGGGSKFEKRSTRLLIM